MQNDNYLREEHNGFDSALLNNIETHGWSSVVVFAADGEKDPLLFYTVGLFENFGHAELVLSGLPSRVAMGIVLPLVNRIKMGESFIHGQKNRSSLKNNVPLCFTSIPTKIVSTVLLKTALLSHRPPNALQICWPDKEGFYPWEKGCCLDKSQQQLLGDNPRKQTLFAVPS